jgi:hypothetical protein
MKTIKAVIQERPHLSAMIRDVVRNIGKESIEDVNSHGIDGGFGGFVYTRDTVAFFDKHRDAILGLAKEMADSLGENLFEMIRGFRCIGKDFSVEEIAEVLYSRNETDAASTVKNGMAWFAAEEVCRMFED